LDQLAVADLVASGSSVGILKFCGGLCYVHNLLANRFRLLSLLSAFFTFHYCCPHSENSKMLSYAAQLPTEDPDDDYENGLQDDDDDDDFHNEVSTGYSKVGGKPSIEMVSTLCEQLALQCNVLVM
jgi:hypothetical protein